MENAEQLTSVPTTFTGVDTVDYVTVVLVGSDEPVTVPKFEVSPKVTTDYVTVLKIGNDEDCSKVVTEETFVYRLPGEKLGFGLKFEGGTKPDEFVKRLFIQSCAVNSPASRVQSSWGSLTEGDEVLEIDSVLVNSMTRIDCVRCLKNSNVVIKLLIRHRFDTNTNSNEDKDSFSRLTEDLPLVVSAEKKRTPPPPPPVPPRKVSRKTKEAGIFIPPKGFDDTTGETNPSLRSNRYGHNDVKNNARKCQPCLSPEASKTIRRPPDAEVYTDLFTQESTYSLSESDDTGSSISTVVDRLGSFPTTTNSSFAGSLPSTPTPVQRHINLTDDIDFSNKLVTDVLETSIQKPEEMPSSDGVPLQPPANFQDAPLSYGNEHVPIIKQGNKSFDFAEQKAAQPPPPPPRNKNQIYINIGKQQVDAIVTPNLPRLVDFVPKSNKKVPVKENQSDCEVMPNTIEIVTHFLENEKQAISDLMMECYDNKSDEHSFDVSVPDLEAWNEDDEVNSFGWNLPTKLATIGEDAEEEMQPESHHEPKSCKKRAEIEGCHNAETTPIEEQIVDDDAIKGMCNRLQGQPATITKPDRFDVDTMDSPPIYSRQPPDGHEFPDYQEVLGSPPPILEQLPRDRHRSMTDNLLSKDQHDKNNVRDKIAIFSNAPAPLTKKYTSSENITLNSSSEIFSDSLTQQNKTISKSAMSLDNLNGFSRDILSIPTTDKMCGYSDEKTQSSTDLSLRHKPLPRLHVRSQSLTNMSLPDFNHKHDRWSLLVEQRRKGLSKLKDLVIPEHVSENDINVRPVLDLPEIKSNIFPSVTRTEQKNTNTDARQSLPVLNSSTSCLSSSPWFSKPNDTMPKYSPAFKRKSLQIYGATLPVEKKDAPIKPVTNQRVSDEMSKSTFKANEVSKFEVNIDAPKSLESITSPTRSDCSFEYASSPEFRNRNVPEIQQTMLYTKPVGHIEVEGRSEDDSDSDSALSSSQSSYVSKNSSSDSAVQLQIEYTSHALCSVGDVQANERHCQAKFQNSCQLEIGNYDSMSRRLLKPQSVEAINRKNILASAKCRSGRDLKVGSPLIQRKFDEDTEKFGESTTKNENIGRPELPITSDDQSPKTIPKVNEDTPQENEIEKTPPTEIIKKTEVRKSVENLPRRGDPIITPNKKAISSKPFGIAAATSVTDLRKNFEKANPISTMRSMSSPTGTHQNVKPIVEMVPIKRTSLPILAKTDPVTRDIVSEQVAEKMICDTLTEFGDCVSKEDLKVILLKPEIPGGSLGITLAGGVDYETKEITVHKIRNGSLAFKDGRLRKGDKILSINGKYMKGLSHGESLAALKENVPEFTIVACAAAETNTTSPKLQSSFKFEPLTARTEKNLDEDAPKKDERVEVIIAKDAAGLGFSIQGGKGSVQGDLPLVIKKLFVGGPAERSLKLKVGDELLEINRTNVSAMSRIDAWNLMKKLPEGEIVLLIRR